MHCLETLHRLNAKAAARPAAETETTRHCSYSGDEALGLVLHSAKQRSTCFLSGASATYFLTRWLVTNSVDVRDQLVESYF